MANLLSWSGGLSLQKKKNENQLSGGSTISSLRNPFQIAQTINNQIRANKVNGFQSSNNTGSSTSNNSFQQQNFQQQNDFQAQQAEQQRRQQEEQRRQQIERMRQEQEQRQQQEREKQLQQQQAQQQKQQQLLNSSLGRTLGDRRAGLVNDTVKTSNRGGLLGTLGAQNNLDRRLNPVKTESDKSYDKWLSTTSMDDLSKELDKARADNNTDWIRRIQQYSGKSTNDIDVYKKQVGAQNSELNLSRSAATDLRNVNDTKTYDNIDVNDSNNVRYFGRQNLLKKTLKSALGDNADVSGMSYHDVINAYNNASGDQQADIKKAIADEIVDQKKYAKQGNQESLKSISYLADLNALLNQYGNEKGKSFGKQVGDWLSTGGFVGNIGGNALTEALGNITGTEDNTKAYLEKQQNTRDDLGVVGAADAALTGISNTALNLGTGGWYGLANAGVNTANTINSLDDKVLDFDDYGKASLRDKEQGEQLSELGSTAINDLFAVAGKVGVGPGLGRGSLKDIAKYAWQEPLWAGGTTLAQEGFSNLGKGKDFGDYDWGKVGQSFAANLGQDIGMDLFNLGRGRAQTKIMQQQSDGSLLKGLQEGNLRRQDDGTLAKVNPDGTTSRLSDSELAQAIRNESPARKVSQQTNDNSDISHKNAQFELLQKTNPMQDDYHTGIRSADEINNLKDLVNKYDENEMFTYPDFTLDDARRAVKKGSIPVFSSYPIEAGTFISPSKMMATDYAGGDANKVYSKEIPISDFAAIRSGDEGNYLPVKQQKVARTPEQQIYDAQMPKGEVKSITEVVNTPSGKNSFVTLLRGTSDRVRNVVKKAIGIDVAGYNHTMDSSSIKHAVNRHANDDIPLRTEDFNLAPDIIKNADTIEYAGKNRKGLDVIRYTKQYDNQIAYLEEVRNGRHQLATDTMYWLRKGQQKSTPAGELSGEPTSSLRALSRPAGSAYENSLSQNSENVNNSVTKLADLGYDVSKEIGSRAKKVAKKAADVANKHPLGGTTKLVDSSEVEDGGTERTKFLNFTNLKDPVKDALKSGEKMTTQEFFKANNIESNDLAALKQNYPNEVAAAQKLIKAGVTPETFNSKVFNSDGSRKSAYKGQEIPPMRAIFEMAYNYNKVTDVGSTKDQKKANIFSSDSIKENTMGESSLAKNMSNNEAFSEKTRNKLAGDPVEYKPTTNEERLARANEILSTKSLDEVDSYLRDNYFNTADRNRNSGDTVLAGEFAKMLDADGQYGRATEIINKMSEIATKQGQQIQALSIMSNRSPEGIANMAQTAIQKGGGKVDGELRKQILSNTQDIGKIRAKMAELNTENSDISYKIMNGEGDLPALRKRQMEIGQEYRTCLDQEGRSFAKLSETVSNNSPRDKSIFGSVWRAGLLSGPRTHVGNAVSNTFQNALNAGADRIAAGLDWARTKITGGEREVVASAGGRGKGLKRGLSAAGEVMKTGTNLWEGTEKVTSGQGANAWGYGGELEFKNKIADTMVAKPTNYVFRAMSAGDLPFRYSAFENAIRTEAKRQGMNQGYKGQALQDYINSRVATPDPDLQAYGIKKGNESVYDADTFLSRTMSSLDKQINKIDNKVGRNAAKTAKTLIAPFVKVPSKVLSTAVDYSPVGAVQAVVKKVGGSKNYSVGQFETDLAKSGLGSTAFVGLGYALSSAGLLTGGYPEEQKERDRWKAEGIEPNSVKIGDKYVSLNYLGPAAILMGMGAGVQKRQEKGQDPFTISVGAVGDTFNAFFEQSYVQGLNSAINAVKDSQRYGESYANSLARGLVPNILRQTAVATDDKQRQVDNPLEAITSGIPGLSKTLDAKVDVYGREIENKQTLPLGQMWDALKISNSRETNDVIDEVSRLHSVDPSNKDLQVTPPQAQSSVSVNGVNVKLTDNQKSQLQKDIGAAALEGMQQVINSSQYQSLSDEEKASALNKARENAQKQVRKQFIEANNITADNNPGTRESGGSATGDFASKAITSATANTEGKSAITANSSLGQSSKDILNKYNSMSKEDWNDYLYGSSAESAAAEYNLAKAKYENNLANNELNDAQKVKKEKELRKLNVSKDWEKKYRDAYSLAGSKSDMQEFLNNLDDQTRAETVGILNGLNRAMYEAGVIQASTYKSRSNAINGTTTAKSSSRRKKSSGGKSGKSGDDGMSSAEASALASLAKTMVKNTNTTKASTPKAPETKRKMTKTKSSSNKTGLRSYSTNLAKKATVTKGAKRSIA